MSAILCLVLAVLLYLKQVFPQTKTSETVHEFDQCCMVFRVVEVEKLEQGEHADHRQ